MSYCYTFPITFCTKCAIWAMVISLCIAHASSPWNSKVVYWGGIWTAWLIFRWASWCEYGCLCLLKRMLQGPSRAENMPLHRFCSLCAQNELRELKRFQLWNKCCWMQWRCSLSPPKREQVSYCEDLVGKCLSPTCRETLEDMLSSKLSTQPCKSLELQGHWMFLQGCWMKRWSQMWPEREAHSHTAHPCSGSWRAMGLLLGRKGVHCSSQTSEFIRVGRNCHETTPQYYLCGWLWW